MTRVRGLADWSPHSSTEERMKDVEAVFEEYADHRPLTIRQVLYRLVAQYGWTKSDYDRLQNYLNRARRSGRIPFDWVRDDEMIERTWAGFDGVTGFWRSTAGRARNYRRKRQAGQEQYLELWVESAGMIPQLARVVRRRHVPVRSRGGFESTTAKYEAARRYAERDRPTVVLDVGDHDPSGVARLDALTEDIRQMVADLTGAGSDAAGPLRFERVAVTPEQIERFDLPIRDPNPNDRRGDWTGPAVQAEALAPGDLAAEVLGAVERWMDEDVLAELIEREKQERRRTVDQVRRIAP